MSFCSDIKNELCVLRPSECCKIPLIYGFLLFSRSFMVERISMQTENEQTAKLYSKLLSGIFDAETETESGGGKRKTYKVSVPSAADRLKILATFDFGIFEGKINKESFLRDCCASSFIRGAFLACGQLSDPQKGYRADFSVRDEALAKELVGLLSEHFIDAHTSKRGNGFVVYIKRREMVINLLTVMGASARSLDLIETTIIKDLSNNTNRARNCDSANISKTVEASIKQRNAIEYLIKTEKLHSLPQELVSAAMLRKEYPSASLSQLAALSKDPISVSGLNHRLKKIMAEYEKYTK